MIAKLKVFTTHAKKSMTQVAAIALVSTLALSPLAHSEETGLAPPATSDVSNEAAPMPEAAPAPDMGGMGSPEATDHSMSEPAPEHTAKPKKSKKHSVKKKSAKKAKKAKKSAKSKKKNKKKKKHTSDY